MKRKNSPAFTLIEIIIVIVIISILAIIAIVNLLRHRLNSNEAIALASLKSICTASQSYRSIGTTYPINLAALGITTPPYIDSVLGCGNQPCDKLGYSFSLTGSTNTFAATAVPQSFTFTGIRSFYIDQSGVIRFCNTQGCDPSSGTVY